MSSPSVEVVPEISPCEEISALPLLIKQSYAANNIDNIIVDVNRHR